MVTSAADSTSTLIELNEKKQQKEENEIMDINEVKEAIQSTILELSLIHI